MNHATGGTSAGKRLLGVFVLVLLAGVAPAGAAETIAGDWEMTVEFMGSKAFTTLSIAKQADGSYTGKWGEDKLSDVKFEDQKLTFVRTYTRRDQEVKTNYEGALKDGKLTGKIKSERGEFDANGARFKPMPAAVGDWDVTFKIGEREITSRLTVSQKPDGALEGKWVGGRGENVVSDVKFKDGALSFTRKGKYNDRETESTFEGVVKGHKLTGKMKSERGERETNGERVGAALVGKWELTTTSDQGERKTTLQVDGDLTGRYGLYGMEVPVEKLKLEDGQVTFGVKLGSGDRTFQLDLKAQLEGKTLKGKLTTSRGDREVTGKKLD